MCDPQLQSPLPALAGGREVGPLPRGKEEPRQVLWDVEGTGRDVSGDLVLEPQKWLLGWGPCPVYDMTSSVPGLMVAIL